MRDDDCRGELLARERRGQLPPEQRPALEAHLSMCESCRLAQSVFADFEEAGAVELRDGLRIQRLSEVARRWGQRPSRAGAAIGRRRRALAVAASLVLVAGSASAAVWWWRQPAATVERPAAAMATPAPGAFAARRPRGVSVADGPIVNRIDPTPAAAGLSSTERARPQGARRAARAEVGGAVLPSTLLRQASDARRAGEVERAIGLYRRLAREFPGSPEAVLSAVPLGVLLLDRGLPAAALTEFDRYLGWSRGGSLIPEALYGRGRALARLGDRDEERRTWQRLLADFPDSSYAPHGRRRFAELR
jgi:tetratricopeptide (TPR) repeat protein